MINVRWKWPVTPYCRLCSLFAPNEQIWCFLFDISKLCHFFPLQRSLRPPRGDWSCLDIIRLGRGVFDLWATECGAVNNWIVGSCNAAALVPVLLLALLMQRGSPFPSAPLSLPPTYKHTLAPVSPLKPFFLSDPVWTSLACHDHMPTTLVSACVWHARRHMCVFVRGR